MLAHNRSHRAAAAYRAAASTLPPVQTLVAVFEGMVRVIGDARSAILEHRIEDRFTASMKLHNVLHGLQGALDFERGGDVARDLNQLYDYFGHRLNELNRTNDPTICDELAERFSELQAAWTAVAHGTPPEAIDPESLSTAAI